MTDEGKEIYTHILIFPALFIKHNKTQKTKQIFIGRIILYQQFKSSEILYLQIEIPL